MPRIDKVGDLYVTRLSLTDPVTGKRHQPRVTARTKRGLDNEIARVRAEFNAGTWVEPDKTTLSEWMLRWHATYKASPASQYRRLYVIQRHILPDEVASIPLGRLRYAHVQDWVDRKVASGLSRNSIASLTTTLGMALNQARRRGLIVGNPCDDVDLPRADARRWCVLTVEEARTLIIGNRDDREHAFWVLAVTLGIRRGELIGLRWGDVDFVSGSLTVQRTLTIDGDGRSVIGETTKSQHSTRTIRLPLLCQDALRRQRVRQNERRLSAGDTWTDSGAVFDSGLGDHWKGGSGIYHRFRALRSRLQLPDELRLHDLRHTAATHMIHSGIPIPTVSKILGHANPAITMKVYAHVLDEMHDEAADRIDAVFSA